MADSSARPLRTLFALACFVVLVAALYFAQAVLIPVILSILLTFLLTPAMRVLERFGLPRIPAAIAVVLATMLLIVGTGLLISRQLQLLIIDLPNHREAIIAKIEGLRDSASESWFSGISATLSEVRERLAQSSPEDASAKPTPVEIVPSQLSFAHWALTPMAESILAAGLVLVLTFFMLLRREDMRNRIIHLWGTRKLARATKALDDAGNRISSFLLMQLAVNVAFGTMFGVGLFLLGIPYPFLGGFLGGLLRHIPFIGVWMAGSVPVLLSVAMLPGWSHAILVFALLAGLELVFAHLIEPIALGHSIGVSEVVLLISLAFWGWLWGVAGMILATPLTACVVVFLRNTPHLRFLASLLGDEKVLKPGASFYQRIIAKDSEEAAKLLAAYRADHTTEEVFSHLMLPAIRMTKLHAEAGQLTPEEENLAYQELQKHLPESPEREDLAAPRVIGYACGELANKVALQLFSGLLPRTVAFEVEAGKTLTVDAAAQAIGGIPDVIVVGVVTRETQRQARSFVKRLRQAFPRARILVGWWAKRHLGTTARRRLIEAGANGVANGLVTARSQLTILLPSVEQRLIGEPVAVR